MVSNRESKFIKSLQLKKFRQSEQRFIVEGAKNVLELLASDYEIASLYVTRDFLSSHPKLIGASAIEPEVVKEADLVKVGTFKTNNAALAVAKIPEWPVPDTTAKLTIALDRINDPGNLGTIIRIADWYGVGNIICSADSVDCYNPKVIAATMGSFARVKVHYLDLNAVVEKYKNVYATELNGENLHEAQVETPALVLMGSESTGLDPELAERANKKVKIPGYGAAESLNVAVSTAVFCDNFMRMIKK